MPGWIPYSIVNLISFHVVGVDFNSLVEHELVFTSVNFQEPLCQSVTLINDGASEERESVLIAMSTLREHVELDSPAQVFITDDDSKFFLYYYAIILSRNFSLPMIIHVSAIKVQR